MRDIGRERASDAARGLVVSSRPRRLSFASVSTTQVYPSSCSSPLFLWPAQQQNRERERRVRHRNTHTAASAPILRLSRLLGSTSRTLFPILYTLHPPPCVRSPPSSLGIFASHRQRLRVCVRARVPLISNNTHNTAREHLKRVARPLEREKEKK